MRQYSETLKLSGPGGFPRRFRRPERQLSDSLVETRLEGRIALDRTSGGCNPFQDSVLALRPVSERLAGMPVLPGFREGSLGMEARVGCAKVLLSRSLAHPPGKAKMAYAKALCTL